MTLFTPQLSNHELNTLSERDMDMVRHVKPGGNWTDIPASIPSARLEQIREMSKTRGIVRTTYYGRLRPDQPAYTIATYYNRPGNGTNIHPWEHRTITSREAARLQSFPDAFEFLGSQGAVRNQIGNAVPPLVAYAVGKVLGPQTYVDLFAGAGGLSYGLSMAGLEGVAAQEIDSYAVTTYRLNHSSQIEVICGDIRENVVQDRLVATIKSSLGGRQLGLLAGGPPCQGFSTAGWRDKRDSRNSLVSYFLQLVEKLEPKNVVIENVEGLLSMGGGKILKGIQNVLSELGYNFYFSPWVLNTEEFGVPQMRRRVFIVATQKEFELPIRPHPYFDKCRGRRETETDRQNLNLAYPITVAEGLLGLPCLSEVISDYLPQLELVDSSYSDWCAGRIDTESFLTKRGFYRPSEPLLKQLQLSI
jgi:DNA (cytosine-5)-methyltransferase 1